jgi:hypothetical protein
MVFLIHMFPTNFCGGISFQHWPYSPSKDKDKVVILADGNAKCLLTISFYSVHSNLSWKRPFNIVFYLSFCNNILCYEFIFLQEWVWDILKKQQKIVGTNTISLRSNLTSGLALVHKFMVIYQIPRFRLVIELLCLEILLC